MKVNLGRTEPVFPIATSHNIDQTVHYLKMANFDKLGRSSDARLYLAGV